MKEEKEVLIISHLTSSLSANTIKRTKGTETIFDDEKAWADLILSKSALIIASAIILLSVYNMGFVSSDVVKKNEIESLTYTIASEIDSVGSARLDTDQASKNYSFDVYAGRSIIYEGLEISVSGEYVRCILSDEKHTIYSARQLSYRTIPISPCELQNLLSCRFAADGSINHPINSSFPYSELTNFLGTAATQERNLNLSRDVRIEKVSVFVTDGNGVKELEYVLVYQ